ncbi:prepilin-type N-terminal cleavage/methylation domain-containing protein [Moraxella nasovis]|uniref:type IV pilus modification PilV family protein n=1 Tax=Moraxella nasovis TaxID=2904121 RepID=UPI001F62447D|nr:prepilin-type N-terminal cleavage/methylation domain-containing protein [Moraxella nasovis]UNU73743.1 prepilin-type N-terminal cleavage/methylation domain-containing protein [Moraxella nasovis]
MIKQSGFSLIEVLAALMIFSVAIFGILAIFLKTGHASKDAYIRTHATTLLTSESEKVRFMNHAQKQSYTATFIPLIQAVQSDTPLMNYQKLAQAMNRPNCQTAVCRNTEFGKANAISAAHYAANEQAMIIAQFCPHAPQSICIIIAWGDTKPLIGSAKPACINTKGQYHSGATCVYLESY